VYHDALSLMCGKTAIQYMKDKGYYCHWILPQKDLMNDGTGELKNYATRPVGNSGELMPLDCSLNAQVHRGVRSHIELTQFYKEGLPFYDRRFSMPTPNLGVSAYTRVWELYPTSSNIVKDIVKVKISARTILEHHGRKVPGLGNQNGVQYSRGEKNMNHGGARKRSLDQNDYGKMLLHADAIPALNMIKAAAQLKFDTKPLKLTGFLL
jgi:hypothetical protein